MEVEMNTVEFEGCATIMEILVEAKLGQINKSKLKKLHALAKESEVINGLRNRLISNLEKSQEKMS